MGLGIFKASACKANSKCVIGGGPAPAGNPDPRRFSLVRAVQCGALTAVELLYPDATNYEGRKLMVFRASESELRKATEIDPHFCDGDHLSPIARFRPDVNGWAMATALMQRESQTKETK